MNIIGAATAGLIAAKRLASLGVDTSVYDQKSVLGSPVRASGILSVSGLETLGIDYAEGITNTLYGANIHAGGKVMQIVSKKPVAHVIERQKLNEICKDEAVMEGAKIITGKRISGSELNAMHRSGVVVGADGAVSTVAKHFKLGGIGRFLLTYKAEFKVDIENPDLVDVFFDNSKYNGLFAWLVPNAEDVLEVGVGIDSRFGNAKEVFDRFLKEPEIRELLHSKKPITQAASIIPVSLRERIVDEKNRVLLIGDAAGQVKPTTGGGIIFGGNAAIAAADTVARYIGGEGRLSDYERSFNRSFLLDLRLHSIINSIYSSLSARDMGRILSVMNTLGVDRFLGTYGDMDRPSLIMKRFFLRSLA